MVYYIVYFDSITQYSVTNNGYFVAYKNKIEDEYNENYILAKKYKSLGAALTRAGINYDDWTAPSRIKKEIENSSKVQRNDKLRQISHRIPLTFDEKLSLYHSILPEGRRVELVDEKGENLGVISNKELYEFIVVKADRIRKKYKIPIDKEPPIMSESATTEEIDDFLNLEF